MLEFLKEEKEEEQNCMFLITSSDPTDRNKFVRGINVTTRGGTETRMYPKALSPRKSTKLPNSSPDISIPENKKGVRFDQSHKLPVKIFPKEDTSEISIFESNWSKFYKECPTFSDIYKIILSSSSNWELGYKLYDDRLYFQEMLCIPFSLQRKLINSEHDFVLHVGHEKLWEHLCKKYVWSEKKIAKEICEQISKSCPTCQACQRPQALKGVMEPTIIPPGPMISVCLDLFSMPTTKLDDKIFDTIVLCVDRHSGWVVGVPMLNKGLTGSKAAKAMLEHQWRPFGIPSIIMTDLGPQFVSAWWETMCATLGIRHAFSHPYYHQTNGRAEKGGQQLIERLRKINVLEKLN